VYITLIKVTINVIGRHLIFNIGSGLRLIQWPAKDQYIPNSKQFKLYYPKVQ